MNGLGHSLLLRRRFGSISQWSGIALLCLGSCSQEYDRQQRDSPGAGGEVTQTGGGGNFAGTNTNGGVVVGGGATDTVLEQGGVPNWGSAGADSSGYSGVAGGGVGGISSADAGQPGVGASLGHGGSGDTVACPLGAAGCPSAICHPGFMDCNNAIADGCEAHLYGLSGCGTTCSNLVACAPNQVCNFGACGAPQGLVKIIVPLTMAEQGQRYGYKFPEGTDLRNATLILRVHAPGAGDGVLDIYPTDVSRAFGTKVSVKLTTLADGWTDVRIPVGGGAGSYNPGDMYQLTLEILAGGSGTWANPTIVYLDGLWSSNGVVQENFTNSIGPIVTSTLLLVEGSEVSWIDT